MPPMSTKAPYGLIDRTTPWNPPPPHARANPGESGYTWTSTDSLEWGWSLAATVLCVHLQGTRPRPDFKYVPPSARRCLVPINTGKAAGASTGVNGPQALTHDHLLTNRLYTSWLPILPSTPSTSGLNLECWV